MKETKKAAIGAATLTATGAERTCDTGISAESNYTMACRIWKALVDAYAAENGIEITLNVRKEAGVV